MAAEWQERFSKRDFPKQKNAANEAAFLYPERTSLRP